MLYKILLLVLMLSSYGETDAQNKNVVKKAIVVKQVSPLFVGNYEGINNAKAISINLKADGVKISGSLILNGESAKISGIASKNIASGKIIEDISGKVYAFYGERKSNKLFFSITFPEYNNQVVKMELTKIIALNTANLTKQRDSRLLGTWRNTEVISSGSGEFYSSFSTDYFLTLNADGSAFAWSGKSAGGTKDVMVDANGNGKAQKMEWYTRGKSLFFVDPLSRKQSSVSFYAEPARMMLSTNNSKKVYHRMK